MRRRLYFIIPSITEAKPILDKLLLERICIHQIHVLAKEGVDIGDLPEATLFQKYDIINSMLIGTGIGAIIGIIAGLFAHSTFEMEIGGGMIIAMLIGAVFGAWSSSMIGMMVPNTHLKPFQKQIERGKLLMMVDVPKEKVKDIEALVKNLDSEAHYKGIEPTIPGFP